MIGGIEHFISDSDLELVDVKCSTCGNTLKNHRYAVKFGEHAEDSLYCFENAHINTPPSVFTKTRARPAININVAI